MNHGNYNFPSYNGLPAHAHTGWAQCIGQQPQAQYQYSNAIPTTDGISVTIPAGFEIYQQPYPQQSSGQNQPYSPGTADILKDCEPATICQQNDHQLPTDDQSTPTNVQTQDHPKASPPSQTQNDPRPAPEHPGKQAQGDYSSFQQIFAEPMQQQQLTPPSNASPAQSPAYHHARGDCNAKPAKTTKSKAHLTTSRSRYNNSAKISTAIYKTNAPLPSSYAGHIPGFKHYSNGRTFGQAFTSSKQFIDECLYKNKK